MRQQLILLLLVAVSRAAFAANTYYVDPDGTCSNANAGTSSGSPWCNPPGTRLANDSGFWSAAWGSITTSAKVACGDTILLKGGSTQDSGQGGAWKLTTTYYTTTCTAASPITIKVATSGEWTGSSGHFTVDGTSVTSTYGTDPDYKGLVFDTGVDGLILSGASASQRLRIIDSTGGCGLLAWIGISDLLMDYLEISNSGASGLCMGDVTNWRLDHALIHGSGQTGRGHGIDLGLHVDSATDLGGILNSEIYDNGNGSSAPFDSDGIYFVATEHIWMRDSIVRDEQTNCINGGSVMSRSPQAATYRTRLRNNVLRNCGVLNDLSSAQSGTDFGGDCDNGAPNSYMFLMYTTIYGNPGSGLFGPHDGGMYYAWNNTVFGNGWRGMGGGKGNMYYDTCTEEMEIKNTIVKQSSYSKTILAGPNSCGWSACTSNKPQIVGGYNLFDYNSADSESFSFDWGSGNTKCAAGQSGGSGTAKTFATASTAKWTCSTDRISTSGTRYTPDFVSTGGNCDVSDGTYADCDFRLQGTSDAIDYGTFFLRANGAGTNATTITVKKGDPNGTTDAEYSDPRNFFVEPTSYLGAVADTIEIEGCGEVTISSMTATTITFTPACSWADNAGIHLPWNGTAPDIGAYEYAACHGGR